MLREHMHRPICPDCEQIGEQDEACQYCPVIEYLENLNPDQTWFAKEWLK